MSDQDPVPDWFGSLDPDPHWVADIEIAIARNPKYNKLYQDGMRTCGKAGSSDHPRADRGHATPRHGHSNIGNLWKYIRLLEIQG